MAVLLAGAPFGLQRRGRRAARARARELGGGRIQVGWKLAWARTILSAAKALVSTSTLGALRADTASMKSSIERTSGPPTGGRPSLVSYILACLRKALPDGDLMNAFR